MAAIDLPAIIAGLTRRRKPIVFPAIFPSSTLERELFLIFVQVPKEWARLVRERILPAYSGSLQEKRMRDDAASLAGEMDFGENDLVRLILRLTPRMRDWLVRAEKYHRRKFAGAAKTAANVDLSTILTVDRVETTLDAVLQRNVSLVRNVSDEIRGKIADAVFRGFNQRMPRRDLGKIIDETTQLGRQRSLLIASDQTTKLSADLDRERQQEIGIEKFIWRHSGKVHYRPEHKARDGKVYSWENNDLDGDLPGVAINCGCKAQAYVEVE